MAIFLEIWPTLLDFFFYYFVNEQPEDKIIQCAFYFSNVPAHGVVDLEMLRLLVELPLQHGIVRALDDQVLELADRLHAQNREHVVVPAEY